jgi:hypothetical protein
MATEPAAPESPTWLSVDMRLGDRRLPMTVSVRADNSIGLVLGSAAAGMPEYSTTMNADDLKSMIDFLQIAHGAAMPLPEEESTDGSN